MPSELWTDAYLDGMRGEGDPLADEAVAAVFAEGSVGAVNRLMQTLVLDDGMASDALPPIVRDYLARTAALPAVTATKVARGEELFGVFGPEVLPDGPRLLRRAALLLRLEEGRPGPPSHRAPHAPPRPPRVRDDADGGGRDGGGRPRARGPGRAHGAEGTAHARGGAAPPHARSGGTLGCVAGPADQPGGSGGDPDDVQLHGARRPRAPGRGSGRRRPRGVPPRLAGRRAPHGRARGADPGERRRGPGAHLRHPPPPDRALAGGAGPHRGSGGGLSGALARAVRRSPGEPHPLLPRSRSLRRAERRRDARRLSGNLVRAHRVLRGGGRRAPGPGGARVQAAGRGARPREPAPDRGDAARRARRSARAVRDPRRARGAVGRGGAYRAAR